ncbi:ABC transporter ATP-binding protein [Sphingomonas sp.]|uniref:ATP-binding cassette domain-containing protein n=1 Tax=Sphingomonas sp. TaxID=28214 RepID=UPI001B1443AA|nr:ABC transporter ATP-binding protein [Sphingomonas sp.]MBO9715143.1 ABC transporter ATP-binding protein [Sphingomonas sp.]
MTTAIQLAGASVDRSGTRVLHDVDLVVPAGSWFGLIGANGSGKTSLLRALAGRLPFAAGTCIIDGADLVENRMARAQRFGFAPPGDRLPDALRVRDLLELVSGSIETACERLGPVRAALGIDPLLHKWVGDCSAGMRQRAAIALAFAGSQSLVVLDEPFNWLDPVAAFDLRQALRALVDGGLTLLTALHDLGTLATACDEGMMLADGRVALVIDRSTLAQAAQSPQAFERRTIDLLRSGAERDRGRRA